MKGRTLFFTLLLLAALHGFSQEICNNGKDDDGDGLTDLQDPDCWCHYTVKSNLLQNGSFEDHNGCPTNYSYSNDYNIADHWQYANYTAGNVAQYYHNLQCPYDSAEVMLFLPPALPLPDGNAFMSIRQYVYRRPQMTEKDIAKVYISQCLQQPLVPGTAYTLAFSAARFQSNDDYRYKFKTTPFTVAVFGNSDCNAVPFGPVNAISNGCPANFGGWVLLGKTTLRSKGRWTQGKINFEAPFPVKVIAIGPDCSELPVPLDHIADSTSYLDFYVYDMDDLHLLPTADFHFQYIQGHNADPCAIDTVLSVPSYNDASYQWYKDSIAITGATGNRFILPPQKKEGHYNVLISTPDTCFISETYTVSSNDLQALDLPGDTSLCGNDSLLIAPPLRGVIYSWEGGTSAYVVVSAPGVYHVNAISANGCSRTFTVTVHPQNCGAFMPNAFTPNGDGLNDVFRIPAGVPIDLKSFSVYDRWGKRVFETTKRFEGWDGEFRGTPSATGTYLYLIRGVVNNRQRDIKGYVTLVR